MADFSYIIQEINTNLPDNNQQRITAHALRQTMVDLTYTISDEQNDWELQASYILDDVEHALDNIIVDNLTSSYTDRALSANQGKELNYRLTDVEDKTKYIDYADSQYTNMRGILSIDGVEADNGQFETLSVDAIDIGGEDLDDTLSEITDKTDQLDTGIYDNRSYMRVMTNDLQVESIQVGDTTTTDYLEVVGDEMSLGNIVIKDYNRYLTTDAIYAYSYMVVGTHNVASELTTLNEKMVKCTQQQYDTWSALGQIDSNKYYFIIESSSSSTASTTSLDTTSLSLTKSANLSTISVDESSIVDERIEETTSDASEDVVETTSDIKTDVVEEK